MYYVQSGGHLLAHLKQYNVIVLSMLLSDIWTECPQQLVFSSQYMRLVADSIALHMQATVAIFIVSLIAERNG